MPLKKQSLIYLVLTWVAVLFAAPIHLCVIYIDTIFVQTNIILAEYFTSHWLAKTITLIALPFGIVGIPGGLYWLVSRKKMPYFLELTWGLWVMLITSNLLIH